MLAQKLMGSAGDASDKLYVDSVFSTYTYTGNGSTQTINNGIDLAGNGGLVWIKARSIAYSNSLWDTLRGGSADLHSESTQASGVVSGGISAFGSAGFTLDSSVVGNASSQNYASWTFRKAPKFFDVVTYTGNGVSGRQIAHELGIAPGFMIAKRTDAPDQWFTYHRQLGASYFIPLNSTGAASTWGPSSAIWSGTEPTTSVFSIGADSGVNASGGTYVAYLFAHDSSADGIIQCGSFTTNASGNATVNLGWEPQYLMLKATSATSQWRILDSMRDFSDGQARVLFANSTNAEGGNNGIYVTSTGLRVTGWDASTTQIYLAIRRPNKPPTTGTQVYNAIARTGTGAAATVTGIGFAPDISIIQQRAAVQGSVWNDRLRGATKYLASALTNGEGTNAQGVTSFNMDGVSLGAEGSVNQNTAPLINHFFKRAPGFFDVVCHTGNGTYGAKPHGLGVPPALVISKARSGVSDWYVERIGVGTTLSLNSSGVGAGSANTASSIVFYPPNSDATGVNYVSYLFSTLPGISKVGSYTGNGTTQTINCGFTTGARFILIKRTDSTGDWYVWDTARGIVSANDPHLSLNTAASEVTTDDSIDPANSGFIVNQVAATNVNVTGGSYIFLAIS